MCISKKTKIMETKDRYLDINWSFSTSYLFKNMENLGKCLATRFVLQVKISLRVLRSWA